MITRYLIFLILSLVHVRLLCQSKSDTFYLIIPDYLKNGKISTINSHVYFKDATSYIFTFYKNSPHEYKSAGYFIDVDNKTENIINNIENLYIINPYQLMDSLRIYGRLFLRKNIFYVIFFKECKWSVHKAMGEYIYKNYEGDTD